MSKFINLTYNPFFIAMGTTIDNFINSEMILLGTQKRSRVKLVKFYNQQIILQYSKQMLKMQN